MTTQPTPVDVDAILARHAATSPGRWHHRVATVRGIPDVHEAVVTDQPEDGGNVIALTGQVGVYQRSTADAVFIAHAHTDVPEMAAEILRLRASGAQGQERLVEAVTDVLLHVRWQPEPLSALLEATAQLAEVVGIDPDSGTTRTEQRHG